MVLARRLRSRRAPGLRKNPTAVGRGNLVAARLNLTYVDGIGDADDSHHGHD